MTELDAELENVREFTAVPPPVTEFEGVREANAVRVGDIDRIEVDDEEGE